MAYLDIWLLTAYVIIFVIITWQSAQYQWLFASIVLWAGSGWLGSKVLPGIWGITHYSTLSFAPWYILIGSIFFWINHHTTPNNTNTPRAYTLAFWFAYTQNIIGLTALISAATIYIIFNTPSKTAVYFSSIWLEIFWLRPTFWFGLQILLTCVFYAAHHLSNPQRKPKTSSFQQYFSLILVYLCWYIYNSFSLTQLWR